MLFWIFTCALASCFLAAGFLFLQLRREKRPPGFFSILTISVFIWLLFIAFAIAGELSPREIVFAWTKLYGRDTARVALLTTTRFREGQPPKLWVEKEQRTLSRVHYEHLGGTIVKEEIREKTATVIFKARIRTRLGITEQTELYTLFLEGEHWLLDDIKITNEQAPEGDTPQVSLSLCFS